jgi:hypothetical protein
MTLQMMKAAAISKTMIAEQGTSTVAAINRPATPVTIDTIIEPSIMLLKRRQKISAVMIGSESIDIKSITPTKRIVKTIQMATSTVIV